MRHMNVQGELRGLLEKALPGVAACVTCPPIS